MTRPATRRRPLAVALTLCALALCAVALCARASAAPPSPDDKFDLGSVLDDKQEAIKSSMDEAGSGDMKEFTVRTDDNIDKLKVDDVYTSGPNTYFRVKSISSHGTTGGEFTVARAHGTANPDRKFTRVSGEGPLSVVARQTLLDIYIAGGPFLHPIAVLAFFTILLGLNCAWVYRTARQCPPQFVEKARAALDRGDVDEFGKLANAERGLFPHVCRAMVDRFSTSTAKDVEARCELAASAQVNRLRVPVRALNLIAAAAPLLGLLGTIVGMVIVFEAVASASGAAKAQALAAGIRVKLFSTAAALLVAIPALFLYWIFNQRLTAIISRCEILAEEFVHQIRVIKRRGRKASRAAGDDAADEDGEADVDGAAPRGGAKRKGAAV